MTDTITKYRWSYKSGGGVEEVQCIATAKPDYFFVLDAEDHTGGSALWRGGLFDTAEACWDHQVAEAERRIDRDRHDLDRLLMKRQRALGKERV